MDICAHNHKGNPRSVEANDRIEPHKSPMRERIYQAALTFGADGAIAEVLYRPLGICDNSGTARCSELKKEKRLVISGRIALTESGSAADILVADVYA